jgi:hypothetical protein
VYANGSSTFDSSTQKLVSATCTGKKALGIGWSMGGDGQVHITFAGIGGDGTTLVANEDDDGFSGSWQVNAGLVCASA